MRCRLFASWRWRSFQGFGCSPIKAERELGSDRQNGGTKVVILSAKPTDIGEILALFNLSLLGQYRGKPIHFFRK